MNEEYEPKIVGIFCNWCTYMAADLAGTSRMKYAPNVRIVRVMCSGRVEPQLILWAFHNGADGVFIGGCNFGDCHYQEGNYKALRRITLLHKMLPALGIEPERLRLEWISAASADKLRAVADDFTAQLRKLGPLQHVWRAAPLSDEELDTALEKMQAAQLAAAAEEQQPEEQVEEACSIAGPAMESEVSEHVQA